VIFGSIGTVLIAIMIMISTFSCINGLVLAGARVYYAMAKDGLFFKKAGELNAYSVPQLALWVQGILASIWCLSGKYGDLLDMVSFVVILFCILTIFGIFVLRKKRPEADRPYKAFGYPWLAGLYLFTGSAFCSFLIINKPIYAGGGLIITLVGIPLYYWAVGNKK
jgi:APA family basic amino acid/polyamine antiporter